MPPKKSILILLLLFLFFKSLTISFANNPTPTLPPISPIGEQKTLVIIFNFQDQPNNKPFTKEEVRTAIFTGPQSLNNYYREVSYNQTWFTGDVAGWYTIPWDTGCGLNIQEINNMARADGFVLENYRRLAYIHPFLPGQCNGSSGSVGGNPSEAWFDQTLYLGTWAHEIGHNFTLGHANSILCGDKSIDEYYLCQINYYGDLFSPQGTGESNHQNALFKAHLGWIPLSGIKEVVSNGVYTIYIQERQVDNFQLLKIPKSDTSQSYYLEYRRPIGFDNNLPPKVTEGALIYVGQYQTCTSPTDGEPCFSPVSYLIDTTPNSPDYLLDSALSDGSSFVDEINNITIKQLSHDENSVTVSITGCPQESLGNLSCDFHALINETDLTILLARWGEVNLPTIETLRQNWKTKN